MLLLPHSSKNRSWSSNAHSLWYLALSLAASSLIIPLLSLSLSLPFNDGHCHNNYPCELSASRRHETRLLDCCNCMATIRLSDFFMCGFQWPKRIKEEEEEKEGKEAEKEKN